jgi:hypothetical protein
MRNKSFTRRRFDITDEIESKRCRNILLTLGMDLTDDSIKAHLTVLLRCLLKKFWGIES